MGSHVVALLSVFFWWVGCVSFLFCSCILLLFILCTLFGPGGDFFGVAACSRSKAFRFLKTWFGVLRSHTLSLFAAPNNLFFAPPLPPPVFFVVSEIRDNRVTLNAARTVTALLGGQATEVKK